MKKLLKILAWLAAVVVVLVVVAIVAVELFFPVEKVKAMAIEKGSAALGRPIRIGNVKLSFWGGLGVRLMDVSVGNPPGFEGTELFKAQDIDVKLRLLPLLTKTVKVDRFIVDQPTVSMLKTKDGANNYTFGAIDSSLPAEAQKVPPEAKTAAAAVSFEKLEVKHGQVSFRNDSTGFAAVLENLNLSTALENPSEGVYFSTGRIKVDSLRITTVQPVPVVSAALNYRASYDMSQKHLTFDKADFDVSGIKLDLTGDLFHPAGGLRGRARLKTESIAITDVLKLLPPQRFAKLQPFRVSGDFAVDVDVEYDVTKAPAFIYSGTAVVTDMTLAKKDIPGELKLKRMVVDAKPDNIRVSIDEGVFNGRPVKGSFVVTNFADPQLNGDLTGYLDFIYLKPFLPVTDRHELTGEAQFNVKFAGRIRDPRNMDFSGDVDIEHGSYNARFLPEPIDTFNVEAFFNKQVVDIRKFTGKSRSANLSFTGRIDNLIPWILADSVQAKDIHPGVDGTVEGQVNLAALNSFLPPKRHPSLTGQLSMNLAIAGNTGDLTGIKPRGTISVVNASYQDSLLPEPVKRLDAEMRLSPDTVSIDRLAVKFVSSDASFTGQLAKPFPYLLPLKNLDRSKMMKPFFAFKLSSSRFDTDKLFPAAVPGSGAIKPSMPIDSVPGVVLPDIDGQGSFNVDTLVYDKIEFSSIKGKIKISNRKIDCYDVAGKVYTGAVAGKTTIDLTDFEVPKYSGDFTATQIEANDFVTRFSPFGGHLFGKFDVNGQYNASGWESSQFMNSLTLNGLGNILDGKLVTSGALYDALKGIAAKAGQTFNQEQALKGLKTKISIKDGKVYLDNLVTTLGGIGDIDLGGYYGFNGDIGYTGTIFLTRELSQGIVAQGGLISGLAGLVTDPKTQRMKLPLKISGTITNPNAELDYSAVQKGAADKLKQNATDLLQGLIKKKQP